MEFTNRKKKKDSNFLPIIILIICIILLGIVIFRKSNRNKNTSNTSQPSKTVVSDLHFYRIPGTTILKTSCRDEELVDWSINDFLDRKNESNRWEASILMKGSDQIIYKLRVGIKNVTIVDSNKKIARLRTTKYIKKGKLLSYIKHNLSGYCIDPSEKDEVILYIPVDSLGKYLYLRRKE